ncbi:hypothetical protein MAE02_64690 [Microvirga aerophila]|uniref:Uncharacterized protein n=1 Tax=Microvirga aerophila TaxID=670291 RepID=A0A512C3J4_9HYPH|nr:hypothetical protein MAE02_64690 [Microvirga aerophila]
MRIVGRLAGAREVNPGAMVIGPQVDQVTGELGAIVRTRLNSRQVAPSSVRSSQPSVPETNAINDVGSNIKPLS